MNEVKDREYARKVLKAKGFSFPEFVEERYFEKRKDGVLLCLFRVSLPGKKELPDYDNLVCLYDACWTNPLFIESKKEADRFARGFARKNKRKFINKTKKVS